MVGRYYAMDRDHRWDRIQQAYELLLDGVGDFQVTSACAALEDAYARGESDEFVKSTAIVPEGEHPVTIEDGDVLVFVNYRSDRARQLTRAFTEENFDGFARKRVPRLGRFVSLTEYNKDFAYPGGLSPGKAAAMGSGSMWRSRACGSCVWRRPKNMPM